MKEHTGIVLNKHDLKHADSSDTATRVFVSNFDRRIYIFESVHSQNVDKDSNEMKQCDCMRMLHFNLLLVQHY